MRSPSCTFRNLFAALATAGATLQFLAVAPGSADPTRGGIITYRNAKYGFSLAFPSSLFPMEAKQAQPGGGLWETHDGKARVLAVAGPNASGDDLMSYRAFLMEETYKDAKIDYAPVRDNWFVLSGQRNGQMFYERINLVCDGRYIYGWQMLYPVTDRKMWDRVVEFIHRSYRPGRGEDGRCGPGTRDPS